MSDQRITAAEAEESCSTIKPETGRNIQKVTSVPRIMPQASDEGAMQRTVRMKMPKYEAPILLGPTHIPKYLEKWDTGPSSIGPTSLDLERSLDSRPGQAAIVRYSQQSFRSYLAENPGMERHLIENHSFSWNVSMDQFRKMLHDDEEWRREFSKDTTGLAPRGTAGENGQTTLTHKAPEAKKDSGSSDDSPLQSVTDERSMKVSRRVTRDKASNHVVDSDKSSEGGKVLGRAAEGFTKSLDKETIPHPPTKRRSRSIASKKRPAAHIDSDESSGGGDAQVAVAEKKRKVSRQGPVKKKGH